MARGVQDKTEYKGPPKKHQVSKGKSKNTNKKQLQCSNPSWPMSTIYTTGNCKAKQ